MVFSVNLLHRSHYLEILLHSNHCSFCGAITFGMKAEKDVCKMVRVIITLHVDYIKNGVHVSDQVTLWKYFRQNNASFNIDSERVMAAIVVPHFYDFFIFNKAWYHNSKYFFFNIEVVLNSSEMNILSMQRKRDRRYVPKSGAFLM